MDEQGRAGEGRGEGEQGGWDAAGSPWRTHGERVVYRNPWLAVREYQVTRPDGSEGIYGVVDPGDNVTIVAVDAEERVALVGQFVYPAQRFLWSLPSGKVEEGEDALEAARRELKEEAGVSAEEWRLLGSYYLSPGIASQVSYIYLARGLQVGETQPEATEALSGRWLALRAAVEACGCGEVCDAPAALGIWGAWLWLHPLGDDGVDGLEGGGGDG